MKKLQVAKRIEKFCRLYGLVYDMRIYFSGKCWDYDSSGKKTVIHDIKGSDYCDYSNDDTITIATEGGLYDVLNNYTDYDSNLYDKFASLDFDGHYFEIGNAWNCSFYKL